MKAGLELDAENGATLRCLEEQSANLLVKHLFCYRDFEAVLVTVAGKDVDSRC